jgi:hypothetical protein
MGDPTHTHGQGIRTQGGDRSGKNAIPGVVNSDSHPIVSAILSDYFLPCRVFASLIPVIGFSLFITPDRVTTWCTSLVSTRMHNAVLCEMWK